jgi:hypothetical protein
VTSGSKLCCTDSSDPTCIEFRTHNPQQRTINFLCSTADANSNIVPLESNSALDIIFKTKTGQNGAWHEETRFVKVTGNNNLIGLDSSGYATHDLPAFDCSTDELARSNVCTQNGAVVACPTRSPTPSPSHAPTPSPTPTLVSCGNAAALKAVYDTCVSNCAADATDAAVQPVMVCQLTAGGLFGAPPAVLAAGYGNACARACAGAYIAGEYRCSEVGLSVASVCKALVTSAPTPADNNYFKHNPVNMVNNKLRMNVAPTPAPEWTNEWAKFGKIPTPAPAANGLGNACELDSTSAYWQHFAKPESNTYTFACKDGLECKPHLEGSAFSVISKSCQAKPTLLASLADVDDNQEVTAATDLAYIFIGLSVGRDFGAEAKIRDQMLKSGGGHEDTTATLDKAKAVLDKIEDRSSAARNVFDVDKNNRANSADATYIYIGLSISEDFGGFAFLKAFWNKNNGGTEEQAPKVYARAVWDNVQSLATTAAR